MRDVLKIETDRLTIRRLRLSDAARVSAFTCDPGVVHMTGRIPLQNPEVAAEGWILILLARAPLGKEHVFAVELEGEGLIGCIGAHAQESGAFEFGYWFGRPYWGKGYASEAARAVAAEAQELGPLEAGHFVDNPASGRVLEKAGFVYTGDIVPTYSLGRGVKVPSRRMRYVSQRTTKRAASLNASLCHG
jgi:RimJ/RimL family protein N-acetyltransferase